MSKLPAREATLRAATPDLRACMCRDHAELASKLAPARTDDPRYDTPAAVHYGLASLAIRNRAVIEAYALGDDVLGPAGESDDRRKALYGVLLEYGPLCCLAGDETYERLLRAAGAGLEAWLEWCERELVPIEHR